MPNAERLTSLINAVAQSETAAAKVDNAYRALAKKVADEHLYGEVRRFVNASDIANEAMASCFQKIAEGTRFPNRYKFVGLLKLIATRKALQATRRESAAKRGGNAPKDDVTVANPASHEPTIDATAIIRETFETLLGKFHEGRSEEVGQIIVTGVLLEQPANVVHRHLVEAFGESKAMITARIKSIITKEHDRLLDIIQQYLEEEQLL